MSRRAVEEGALNIGQGFPDYPIDPQLAGSLVEAVAEGHNQYAPMEGVVALRELIARKASTAYDITIDPQEEVTITCGATEALYDAIQAAVGPGDEVIIFDPAYDAYEPAVRLAGGRCLRIALQPPAFAVDWDLVRRHLSERTRLIIINSPQNPSCTVLARSDLEALAALIRDRPVSVLSDEVYENVIFDGRRPNSVLAHPELRERSFAVFSFGKALHATGWRVGYCIASPEAHARAPAGAPVQRVQHRGAAPARHCPLPDATPRALRRVGSVLSGQARFIGECLARLRLRAPHDGGHLLHAGGLRASAGRRTWISPIG